LAGVLITRPDHAAAETARLVARLGFTPILAPMLLVTPRRWTRAPQPAQAILITSANAVPAIEACDRTIPVLAVGDATAARARASGFAQVLSAGRDAEALANLTRHSCHPDGGALLLASGAGQGMTLAAALRSAGFTVRRRVAYGTRAATELSAEAIEALDGTTLRHALFFSPATARAFVACMPRRAERLAEVEALAISPPTARALAPLPWLRIRIASHPNQDELVALLT
jgi:uroporphyrinogen-III synthase